MSKTLKNTYIPEWGTPKQGKVRDIYEQGDRLVMVASDRISVFDEVMDEPIEDKGRILTQLSKFWFDDTKDIIPNHLIDLPDPNIMVVRKCRPLPVEVIVRGYICGSLWRDYQKGNRIKCGIQIPDGLKENEPLPEPIITPTTKDVHDRDITKEEIVREGLVDEKLWDEIERVALELFKRGQETAKKRGLILVDTKYEFGVDTEGNLTLIDEVHTPDSSRYWYIKDQERKSLRFPDKEMVREWVRDHGFSATQKLPSLTEEIRMKTRNSYREIYRTITGEELEEETLSVQNRVLKHLKERHLIKGAYTVILSGSEKDAKHVQKITDKLEEFGIPHQAIVASAHKHPDKVFSLLRQYNQSLEPLVFITVAGRSNALSGVVAANTHWPVIACPPFKDHADYLVNIHSSVQMPSYVPSMTVIDPGNAGIAAARILNTMELAS